MTLPRSTTIVWPLMLSLVTRCRAASATSSVDASRRKRLVSRARSRPAGLRSHQRVATVPGATTLTRTEGARACARMRVS